MKTRLVMSLALLVVTCVAFQFLCYDSLLPRAKRNQFCRIEECNASIDCDWPMSGRTPEGNMVAPDGCGSKTDKLALKWKHIVENTHVVPKSEITIYKGRIYFLSSNGGMYCFDIESLKVIWKSQVVMENDIRFSSITISDNMIFIQIKFKGLFCLNADTGESIKSWKEYSAETRPVIIGKSLFIVTNNNLICYSLDAMEEIWNYKCFGAGNYFDGNLIYSDGKVIVCSSDYIVYCFSANSGEKVWEFNTKSDGGNLFPVVSNSKVYLVATHMLSFEIWESSIYCLSAETGEKNWHSYINATIRTPPVISNGKIYFGTDSNSILCLSSVTGDQIWDYDLKEDQFAINGFLSFANNRIYFATATNACSLSADKGEIVWEYELCDGYNPIISQGEIYIVSGYNSNTTFYCFNDEAESAEDSSTKKTPCYDNCNDCDKYMIFKINSKDWGICGANQPPMSAAPIVYKGRTFLVIKYIADSIGATIEWEKETKRVKIASHKKERTIALQIGKNIAQIDCRFVHIDENPEVKPFISEGRTLLPLRFIADALGLEVEWQDKTKEATICFRNPKCDEP